MRYVLAVLLCLFAGCGDGDGSSERPPRVFLWGDSIRLYYEPTVIDMAGDSMEIWSPQWYFGMTAPNLLSRLHEFDLTAYDVFHINAGLHDEMVGVSPAEYEAAFRQILTTIRIYSDAPIILATTTQRNDPPRPVLEEYNTAIKRAVLMRPNVYIDDLRSFQRDNALVLRDGIHFDDHSAMLMGMHVFEAIQQSLR